MNTATAYRPDSNGIVHKSVHASACRIAANQTRSPLQTGFQLIEMMIVTAIIAIVGLIAVPSYSSYTDKTDYVVAKTEIREMAQIIEQYYSGHSDYPDSLDDIGKGSLLDPWGNNYRYQKIYGVKLRGKIRVRKDKHLAPVNSDFDLYSNGKDGLSRPSFRAKHSLDDIVRCSNGMFIGYAVDF